MHNTSGKNNLNNNYNTILHGPLNSGSGKSVGEDVHQYEIALTTF